MVSSRRLVQIDHERFVVSTFLNEINRRHRSTYRVVEEPNPPEAIIRTGRITRWVEVTTAFWNDAFAKDVFSYATPGEMHKPISEGPYVGPDAMFARRFVSVVKQKLEKASYEKVRAKYGKGYLVVSIQYPLFGRDTGVFMQRAWAEQTINDRGCFRSIYFLRRAFKDYALELWRP